MNQVFGKHIPLSYYFIGMAVAQHLLINPIRASPQAAISHNFLLLASVQLGCELCGAVCLQGVNKLEHFIVDICSA